MFLEILEPVHWTDVLDVALVAVFLWATFAWLRQTRSRMALLGVLLLSGVYLAARELDLQLTVWLLQGFFAVLVFVLVVVFQEDLRRIFEQIAVWGLRRRVPALPPDDVETLVHTIAEQTRRREGALYVIPGRDPLDRHLDGGIALDAEISLPLLLSLFDPHSPGHDGAVTLAGSRVSRFALHLPLSTRRITGGTRHSAALGLAERCDALCIVVSEERAVVSVARDGTLRQLQSPASLGDEIREFLDTVTSAGDPKSSWRNVVKRWPEAAGALATAVILWAFLVPGSDIIEVTKEVPVVVENLPAGFQLTGVEPSVVEVTFNGPRRRIPDDPEAVRLRIDALLVELGRRTFRISPAQVEHPPGVVAVDVQPRSVRLSIE